MQHIPTTNISYLLYIVEELSDCCPPLFAEQLFAIFSPPSEKVPPSEKAAPTDRINGRLSAWPEMEGYRNTY